MKVLVLEEDQQIIRDISFCLKIRYPEATVSSVARGSKGIEKLETESSDLVIVGCPLSDMEIPDLAARIRELSDCALIVFSNDETEMDRAKGFEAGVDEYVAKPPSPIELLARVRALLRRTQKIGFKPERLVCLGGKLIINFISREVFLSGKSVKLTPSEYAVLLELVRNEGMVLTHRSLIDKIGRAERVTDPNFTKRYIYQLRKKLNDDPANPRIIRTERGVGYKLITSS